MKLEWTPRKRAITKAIAGFTVVVVLLAGVLTYRSCTPGVTFEDGRAFAATLEPAQADSLGVDPASAFTLRTEQPVPLSSVRSALSVEPAVECTVKAADQEGKVFTVTPDKPLEPERVYRFRLNLAGPADPGYSWAFQVAGDPRVTGTLPGDRTTNVPVNTGIEIEFSREGVAEPGSSFTISPFVPGRWERHRRTLVYVPATPLKPGTIYTCTLKAGLGVEGSSKTLAADYTFSFETQSTEAQAGGTYFYIDTSAVEFSTKEPPFFSVNYGNYSGGRGEAPDITAKVYRYRDAAGYLAALAERDKLPTWAYATRQAWTPPTAGLEPILETSLEPQEYQWQEYVVLPAPLDAGFYLTTFRVEAGTYSALFQVTDLSCYTLEASNDTVLWFNSLATGQPVASVLVRKGADGAPLGASGADGIARFATPAQLAAPEDPAPGSAGYYEPQAPYYALAKAPDGSLLVIDLSPGWNPLTARTRTIDGYWSYLHTERPLYLPDDEVRFWGVLQPRDRDAAEVGQATVELRSDYGVWCGPFGGGWSGGGDASLISRVEVDVRHHTFDGSVTLPNLRPGYYRLELTYQGVTLSACYFEVATYTKPAYRISLSTDKKAVFVGETVHYYLDAAFFEGTPVSELRLDYHLGAGDRSTDGALVTDITGRATLAHTPEPTSSEYGVERGDYLQVNADLPESGPIWAQTSVRVFEKNVLMRSSVQPEEGGTGSAGSPGAAQAVRIEACLNQVDLERINNPALAEGGSPGETPRPWYLWEPDYLGAPVAGRKITGHIEEIRWDARESGQYYDFINKVTVKTYDYTEVRVPVTTFTMTTGPDGTAAWTFTPDPKKSYSVRLDSRDDAGRPIAAQSLFYGTSFVGPDWGYHWYHLAPADREQARYAAGERVALQVRDSTGLAPERPKGYLFYTARKGLDQVVVKDTPDFDFTFEESFIPNTNAGAVYFDGRYYNSVNNALVAFDYSARRLDVSVGFDKESYAPGDKAVITVEVKDLEGRPVGAEVNLSMVDEALFALADQQVDLLGGLYSRAIGSYVLTSRGSHFRRLEARGGAEMGGEGGMGRQNFVDTALFTSLTTGADGKGSVEVTLPDNLTSWRLTYAAFASDVRAASGSLNVPVRLPFFVELAMNETYLTGDQPGVQARGYGAALPAAAAVTFSGRLAQVKPDGTLDEAGAKALGPVNGTAFKPATLDLGTLAKGNYKLTVTGKASLPDGTVLEDTLTKPLAVVDSYLRLDRVDYYQVGEGLRVTATPGELATLTFCDAERGKDLQMIWRLMGGGRRSDMRAAAVVARDLLRTYYDFDEAMLPPAPTASDLMTCQRENGGVGLLPYADPNLELTAKTAALGDIGFDIDGLRGYLGSVYDDGTGNMLDRERFIVACYGLAALGEPVLGDLQRVAGEPNLSVKEKLYTCLGLIALGDEERARGIFGGLVTEYGDRVGPMLRLNVSRDQEEILAATSLAAVVAAELRLPEKGAFLDYLLDNVPWEDLNLLEMALYLKAALPGVPAEPVSFVLGPEGTKVTLKPGETYTCLRTAEALAELGFSKVQGNVGLCVSYRAPVDLRTTKVRSGEAILSRVYSVGGKAMRSFEAGDLVKIVISYSIAAQAPEGPYQLVDFLPSGLKAVPRAWEFGVEDLNLTCPVEVNGQQVTFNVYTNEGPIDPKTGRPAQRGGEGEITYYARVVSPGQYQAEGAVLVHAKSGEIFAITKADVIGIR